MITIQGYKRSNKSIMMIFDSEGIEEFISYLNFIKNSDSSMHLNMDSELCKNEYIDDDMYIIPHLKIINMEKVSSI